MLWGLEGRFLAVQFQKQGPGFVRFRIPFFGVPIARVIVFLGHVSGTLVGSGVTLAWDDVREGAYRTQTVQRELSGSYEAYATRSRLGFRV